jgi:transposase InsO family protein
MSRETSASTGRRCGLERVCRVLDILRRVGRSRVLRLMRENALLSQHRRPQGVPIAYDGTITTDCPNVTWGTDGVRIETIEDGWAWVFPVIDHYDACCVGIHAVKIDNRFSALQPIAQGLKAEVAKPCPDNRSRSGMEGPNSGRVRRI